MRGRRRRVYAKTTPTDLRKGFNGLYGIIANGFGADPLAGDTFVFMNRRRTLVKTMRWDGTGCRSCIKVLAKGRFADLFGDASGDRIVLSRKKHGLLLSGTDAKGLFMPRKTVEKR